MSAKRKDAIEETISLAIGKALDETKKKLTNLGQAPAKAAYKKEQAAAEVDPDVAAMEEAGGMGELDFRDFTEQGLAASRGQEYADEVKGQMEFDKDLPGDFKDMGRTADMEKVASEEFGGEFPDVYVKKSEPIGNVTTVTASPPPVAEKAKFDGAAILDEADIARRAEVPEDKLAELFKKTHGGPFDPKSKADKEKMATITSMIGEDRNLLNISPTQFALKVYARKQ
jgi:hypothetical protein